jgi:zinc protease
VIKNILAICFAIFCLFASAADEENSPKPSLKSKLLNVKQLVSNSGVKFWFMNDGSAPLVHIKIAFKNSGSSYQEKSKTGVPKFYSHTVFCGSGNLSEVEFKKRCSDISIVMSCQAGIDNVVFSMTTPKIVLKDAVTLFNMALVAPMFEKDKVKKIQNGIAYSMQNYAIDPIEIALNEVVPSLIFKSHAYENGSYGSLEDFMKLSVDNLMKYKSQFLVTSNAEACVFGDISANTAVSLMDKVFFGIEKGNTAKDNVSDIDPKLAHVSKKYYVDGPQSTIIFVMKNEKPLSFKRAAAIVLYHILGDGSLKSKIMLELRTKQGLVYQSAIIPIDLNHSNYVFGMLKTDNAKIPQAIASLKKVIKELKRKGITEEELKFAQSNITGSLLVGLRTSAALCQFYLCKMLDGFGTDALSYSANRIAQVSVKEVNNIAKEILDEENMPFIIIGGNE